MLNWIKSITIIVLVICVVGMACTHMYIRNSVIDGERYAKDAFEPKMIVSWTDNVHFAIFGYDNGTISVYDIDRCTGHRFHVYEWERLIPQIESIVNDLKVMKGLDTGRSVLVVPGPPTPIDPYKVKQ